MNNNIPLNKNVMPTKKDEEDRRLTGFAAEVYEWLEAVAFALAIVVLIFTFVFRIVSVDGSSMNPTLIDQDRILVRSLFYTPEQDDIVIIVKPIEDDYNKPLVKRIVAVAGQYVQVMNGKILVGDSPTAMTEFVVSGVEDILPERYGDAFDWSQPVMVPAGNVFVLGDNRNNSMDSRDSRVGMVKEDYLLGEVIFRIYPFSEFGKIA